MAILDKIDSRILYELDKDCRQPLSAIAKKIRKSPQYVKYRVERLKEEQIIQAVSVFAPFPPDTIETFAFITLRGSNVVEERLLLDFLFKLPETHRLYHSDGEFDIIITLMVKHHERLDEIKQTLMTNFLNIDRMYYHALVSSAVYTKKYLYDTLEINKITLEKSKEPMDFFSRSLLFELQKEPFASLLDISDDLHVSYDKIKYAFKTTRPYLGTRLVLSSKIVKKAILFIDAISDVEKIKEHAAAHPNITQADHILGEYTMAIFFESLATEEIHRIIKEFLYEFKDAIRSHTKLTIMNTYKYRWLDL